MAGPFVFGSQFFFLLLILICFDSIRALEKQNGRIDQLWGSSPSDSLSFYHSWPASLDLSDRTHLSQP